MTKKRGIILSISFAGFLLLILIGFGIYYFDIFQDTLHQVTQPSQTQGRMGIYVLKEDPASNLQQTVGYLYGYTQGPFSQEEMRSVFEKLETAMGEMPKREEYPDLFQLTDGLREGAVQAVMFDEAYLESLGEAEGYEWTAEGLKKIGSISFDQQEEESSRPATPSQPIEDSFLVYISGIDSYGGLSVRSRSDVNILLGVNIPKRKILLLATPRDFYVDFSVTNGQKDKLTHAGIYGVEASMDALERLYQVEIPYYVRMNFTGFVEIIDALGGVDVYSEYAFSVANIKDYQQGYNRLTGIEALAFARERYSFPDGDYQRAKNQMEVIKAVIQACASPSVLLRFPSVMEAVGDSFETNMPKEQIETLVKLQLGSLDSWEVVSYTAQGTSAYAPTYSMPGRDLYVILPDEHSNAEARALLSEILEMGEEGAEKQ